MWGKFALNLTYRFDPVSGGIGVKYNFFLLDFLNEFRRRMFKCFQNARNPVGGKMVRLLPCHPTTYTCTLCSCRKMFSCCKSCLYSPSSSFRQPTNMKDNSTLLTQTVHTRMQTLSHRPRHQNRQLFAYNKTATTMSKKVNGLNLAVHQQMFAKCDRLGWYSLEKDCWWQ